MKKHTGAPLVKMMQMKETFEEGLKLLVQVKSQEAIRAFRGKLKWSGSLRDFRLAKNLLLRLPFMPMGGQALALESAANCRLLHKKGVTVRKTIEVMIGTFCIHYRLSLLHDDRDFDPMVKFLGLKTIDT